MSIASLYCRIAGRTFIMATMLVLSFLTTATRESTYIQQITDQYLKSFDTEPERKTNTPLGKSKGIVERIQHLFTPSPFTIPIFSTPEQQELIFKATETDNYSTAPHIISATTAQKADLINHSGERSGAHLLHVLSTNDEMYNETLPLIHTNTGTVYLAKAITHPHTDITLLKNTQDSINTFVTSSTLLSNATKALRIIRASENNFLSFFSHYKVIDPLDIQKFYWKRITLINQSTTGLRLGTFISDAITCSLGCAPELIAVSLFKLYKKYSKRMLGFSNTEEGVEGMKMGISMRVTHTPLEQWQQQAAYKECKAHEQVTDLIFASHKAHYSANANIPLKRWLKTFPYDHPYMTGALSLYEIFSKTKALETLQTNSRMLYTMQTQLMGVANYVKEAKKLYKLIRKNNCLNKKSSIVSALKDLLEPSTRHSAEFNELIQLLGTNTFKGNASFFSNSGNILRAYMLMNMKSIQKEFTDIINAIGEIDTYCALAQKIKLTADKEVRYSFVEFDTASKSPYIHAIDLWNPFIAESKAVTNNIQMGGSQPRNIIMNGPNTGGKSTLSKAMLLNIILAQTFGIVAAKHMTLTPFGNLDCFMNMTDDTASGLSGLKAETKRAKEIINTIKAGNPMQFHFMPLDEIFIATSPDQAEQLALDFLESLASMPNVLFINTTHFEGIVQFGQKSLNCRNCHMGAITDMQNKDRVIKYTYKLIEGISSVKNAAQVAEDSGLTVKQRPPSYFTNQRLPASINAPVA